MSRNRLVIEALSAELTRDAGEWADGFFSPPTDARELAVLRKATRELDGAIAGARRNRGAPLL